MSDVYFISANNKIKIGYTTNLKRRIQAIKTCSSTKVLLLGTIPGGRIEEQQIHKLFHSLKTRYNGEWFEADDNLLSYINTYSTLDKYVYKDKDVIYTTLKIKK